MYRLAEEGIVRVAVGVPAGGRRVGDAIGTGVIVDGQDRPVLGPLLPQIAHKVRRLDLGGQTPKATSLRY